MSLNIAGIDYGRKKVGVAGAEGRFAYPLKVLAVKDKSDAIKKTAAFLNQYAIETLVVGVSEGKMAKESEDFGKKLGKLIKALVVYQDETLSSYEARVKSKEAGQKRTKLKKMEDAYAATLILQSYLDMLN